MWMSFVQSRSCRQDNNRQNFNANCYGKFSLYFVIKQAYTDECILSSNVAFVWCITSAHYFPCQTTRYVIRIERMQRCVNIVVQQRVNICCTTTLYNYLSK